MSIPKRYKLVVWPDPIDYQANVCSDCRRIDCSRDTDYWLKNCQSLSPNVNVSDFDGEVYDDEERNRRINATQED